MDGEQHSHEEETPPNDRASAPDMEQDASEDRERVTLRSVENYMPPVARREWRRAQEADGDDGRRLMGNYSAAFLLGVALVVVTLLTGLLLARLYMRVENLESKVQKLEKRLPR